MSDEAEVRPRASYRLEFAAAALMREHPPRYSHDHKQALYAFAYPDPSLAAGELAVSRWDAVTPSRLDLSRPMLAVVRPDFYDYALAGDPARDVEWHVNFADPSVFVAYGSPLLAQDEMQVVEHPLLGSVREALRAGGHSLHTVDSDGPTPILVRNVERRLAIDTRPDARAGRPRGLYGNLFSMASLATVMSAVTRVAPAAFSNIIAMAAPSGGRGRYEADEIDDVIIASLTGFSAARAESRAADGGERGVIVHTGWWGCGVFGGNRLFMATAQILAARAAGVSKLVLHVGSETRDAQIAHDAGALADRLVARSGGGCSRQWLVDELAALGLEWGMGDGN